MTCEQGHVYVYVDMNEEEEQLVVELQCTVCEQTFNCYGDK